MKRHEWINYMNEITGIDEQTLGQEFDTHFKPKLVTIYNSVTGENKIIDSNQFFNVLDKLVVVESGALFHNHNQGLAVVSKSIITLKQLRNLYKTFMKQAKAVSNVLKMKTYNGSQLDTKTNMNTYYGIQLNVHSKFYNQDVAASITARGRGTVSMNGLTLEACYGRYRPYRVDALMDFIVKSSKKLISSDILDEVRLPSDEELISHVIGDRENYYGYDIIKYKIESLTDYEKKKVFITSNFKEFMKIPLVKDIVREIIRYNNEVYKEAKSLPIRDYKKLIYLDPESPPERIKDICKQYDDLVKSLLVGFYWYEGDTDEYGNEYKSTEDIFKSIIRECVIITDTDSLILTLKPASDYIMSLYPDIKELRSNIDDEFLAFILGSVVINTTSLMVEQGLWRYTGQSGIPTDYRKYLRYKQEYFFKTLQTTDGAKNYIGIITEQEGVFLPIEEIDLKGLSLKKANFNRFLSDHARDIAVNMIAKAKTPDIKAIFDKINSIRAEMPNIFKAKDNLDVFTVSKLGTTYEDTPIGEYRFKAVDTYNKLFDAKINLPGSFLITKIDIAGKEDYIQEVYPDIYDKLVKLAVERELNFTKYSINNRVATLRKEGLLTETVTNIAEEINNMNDINEIKKYIVDLRKSYKNVPGHEGTFNFLEKIGIKKYKFEDTNRIALPLDSETVPMFVTDHIDIRDIAVFENLIAVLIKGLGFTVIRNKDDRQIITNCLSYY